MKDFRTVVRVPSGHHHISLNTAVLTTGSCFSDAIGNRLQSFKVPTLANPFGTTYNPLSIHKLLTTALETGSVTSNLFVEHDSIHHHHDFHSSFASFSKTELEQHLQDRIHETHHFLKKASWLMVTYGTAWVYEHRPTGQIVSNCHKQPGSLFTKSLLSQKHILESFEKLYHELKRQNPSLRIILTVSPVRHIKETLALNSVSKAVLRLTCHTIAEQHPDVEYFPAYEMMMDDLRDYRFYKGDMIHPTAEAEDYIWENFMTRYGDASLKDFIKKWQSIQSALAHKPFHPQSAGHQIFLAETLKKLDELSHLVDVTEERALLLSQTK